MLRVDGGGGRDRKCFKDRSDSLRKEFYGGYLYRVEETISPVGEKVTHESEKRGVERS